MQANTHADSALNVAPLATGTVSEVAADGTADFAAEAAPEVVAAPATEADDIVSASAVYADDSDEFWTEDLLTEEDTCTEEELEEAVKGFLLGDITLAQLEGLSAEELYQVADMGYNLMEEGKLEDARKIFEGLYCYNPFDSYFHSALGAIYQRQGQLESSFDHYLSSVELYDEDIQTWTNLGEVALELSTVLAQSGDNDRAAEMFVTAADALTRAVELDPNDEHPAGTRARVLVQVTVGSMQRAEAN